jgi:signal transduction histidine kinase
VLVIALLLALTCLALPAASQAADAKVVKAKVEKAAEYLSQKGEAGLPEFSDTSSKWAQTPYIFVYDLKGNIIAHGAKPKLVGKNLMGLKDVKGNMFAAEFVAVAKDPGQGWVEYWWPQKGSNEPQQKVSYIKRVPGQDMLVGAGLNNYSKAKAVAEAGE